MINSSYLQLTCDLLCDLNFRLGLVEVQAQQQIRAEIKQFENAYQRQQQQVSETAGALSASERREQELRKELNEVRSDSSSSREPATVETPIPEPAKVGFEDFVTILKRLSNEVKELRSDSYVADLGRRIMSDVTQRRPASVVSLDSDWGVGSQVDSEFVKIDSKSEGSHLAESGVLSNRLPASWCWCWCRCRSSNMFCRRPIRNLYF